MYAVYIFRIVSFPHCSQANIKSIYYSAPLPYQNRAEILPVEMIVLPVQIISYSHHSNKEHRKHSEFCIKSCPLSIQPNPVYTAESISPRYCTLHRISTTSSKCQHSKAISQKWIL
jgi:hypothetical protein